MSGWLQGAAEAWLAAIIEATATKRICLIGITSSASNGSLCELTDLDGEKLCSKSYTSGKLAAGLLGRRGYVRLSTARKHQFRGEADIAARTHFPSRHHWQFPRRNDRKTRVVSVTSVCRRSTIICPIFVVIAACSTSDLATGGAAPRTRMASFGAPCPFEVEGLPRRGLGPKGTIRARGSTRRAARGARGPQWAR